MSPIMTAENPAAIRGAIPQEAASWDILPSSQPQVIADCEAKPTPTTAPTIVWVVDTGMPRYVAVVSQKALPTSAHFIANMRTAGRTLKRSMVMARIQLYSAVSGGADMMQAGSVGDAGLVNCLVAEKEAAAPPDYVKGILASVASSTH
jgi:hypothetical protein